MTVHARPGRTHTPVFNELGHLNEGYTWIAFITLR